MVRSRWRRRRRVAAAAAAVVVATAAAAAVLACPTAAAAALASARLILALEPPPPAARQAAADAPVPPACAGGAAPGARVCVDTDVHVVAAVGGTVTRFDVEDALVPAVYLAVAAATGLSAATDMGVKVDTPPAGQVDGAFLTLRLLAAADTSDAGVAAVSAAGVQGFREGVVAAVAGDGGGGGRWGPTAVGQRVTPSGGRDDAAGAGERGRGIPPTDAVAWGRRRRRRDGWGRRAASGGDGGDGATGDADGGDAGTAGDTSDDDGAPVSGTDGDDDDGGGGGGGLPPGAWGGIAIAACGGNPLTGVTRPPGMSRGRVVNSHATPP